MRADRFAMMLWVETARGISGNCCGTKQIDSNFSSFTFYYYYSKHFSKNQILLSYLLTLCALSIFIARFVMILLYFIVKLQ